MIISSNIQIVSRLRRRYSRIVELIINVTNLLMLRRHVTKLTITSTPLKLVIGAGETRFDGWVNTDLPVFDALCASHWWCVFSCSSIDRILVEHVIEHWTEIQFRKFLKLARQFLSEGAFIRLAVPDGFHPDLDYVEGVRPNGVWAGANDHKILYDHVLITEILADEKYEYRLVEFFDISGHFHCSSWDVQDGFIERSASHDPRNIRHPLTYTSLIIDTWPI